jgi:hypothetical protein
LNRLVSSSVTSVRARFMPFWESRFPVRKLTRNPLSN